MRRQQQCSALEHFETGLYGCIQVRQAGLRCALSAKAHEGRLIVLDTLAVPEAKTVSSLPGSTWTTCSCWWRSACLPPPLPTDVCHAAVALPDAVHV
jgi:hypothetical protein